MDLGGNIKNFMPFLQIDGINIIPNITTIKMTKNDWSTFSDCDNKTVS